MSSFLVSPRTMEKVCGYIWPQPGCKLDYPQLWESLYAMNLDALQARYPRTPRELAPIHSHGRTPLNRFETLKAMDCLLYQASEGDVPQSLTYRMLEQHRAQLLADILRDIPEYAAAEWD